MPKPGPKPNAAVQIAQRAGISAKDTDPPVKPNGLNQIESSFWDVAETLLRARGTLTCADGFLLEQLAKTYSDLRRLEARARKEKFLVATSRGDLKEHPIWKMRNQQRDRFVRLCRMFGLSPDTRHDVSAVKQPEADQNKSRFFND